MDSSGLTKLWFGPLVAVLVVLASTDADAPQTLAYSHLSPPRFDLGEVVRRAHFAFREKGDALEGKHATYRVRVSHEGVAFRPIEPNAGRQGTELRIGPAEISRGANRLDGLRASRSEVETHGAARLTRGAVIERFQNSEHGSEQTWSFAAKPDGDGDLRVRMKVEGLAYAGRNSGGLHFRDASSRLGVRYGHGTWIDARGTRHAVPAAWRDGAIELAVPDAILDSSAYPAVLDPLISPQTDVDEVILSVLPWEQYMPSVASDGTGFFAVWSDGRHGGDLDIFGTRIDASGNLLDPSGILISEAAPEETVPKVAYGAGMYLVSWATPEPRILAARVSTGGALLDPAAMELSATQGAVNPAVGYDGTNFLVAWSATGTNGREIFGVHVQPDGTLPRAPFLLSNAVKNQDSPSVGCDATRCLVAWTDDRGATADVYATIVDPSGSLSHDPSTGLPIAATAAAESSPSVSFGGGTWLVTWTQGNTIHFARVGGGGTVAAGSQLATPSSGASSVSYDGQDFLACFRSNAASNTVACERISPAGALYPGTERAHPTNNAPFGPTVACSGTHALIVWSVSGPFLDRDVEGSLVDASGNLVRSGFAISVAANIHDEPAIGYGEGVYLVAWSDYRNAGADIYATRFDTTRSALDVNALRLSTSPGAVWDYAPAIAYGNGNFLVVWANNAGTQQDDGELMAAVVRASDGAPVKPAFLLDQTTLGPMPAVAFDGSNFLVAWLDGLPPDILGQRIDTAGNLVGGSFVLADGTAKLTAPALAFDGQDTLVVFQDHAPGTPDLSMVRVPVSGAPSSISPLITHPAAQLSPAIECGGGACVVTWLDDRGVADDIFATPVDGSGALIPFGVQLSSGANAYRNRLTFNGTDFLAVWRRAASNQMEIRGARIDTAGAIAEGGLIFHSGPDSWGSVGVASAGGSSSMLIFDRFGTDSSRQVNRAVIQSVSFGPNTPPQISGLQASANPVVEGTEVLFTAAAEDPDGEMLAFHWDFGSGIEELASATASHLFANDGTYTVRVRVTDPRGGEDQRTLQLVVENAPPVPAEVPPQRTMGGTSFQLALSAQDPGVGDVLTWTLLEGPGTLTTDGRYEWTPEPGTRGAHIVRVQVTDDGGGSAELTFTVDVLSPRHLTVGCSSAGPGPLLLCAALCWLALAARLRC